MIQYSLFINNIQKHISLTEKDKEILILQLKQLSVKKNEFLLQAGDVCKYEYFVTHGALRTYSIDPNGFEHVLMFSVEDWWAGDMYSFLTGTPASYFIETLEDTDLLVLDRPGLDYISENIPMFEKYRRIILQNSFITQQQRITQNLSSTAEQRFLQFEKKYPTYLERFSQKQIAAYLGITPEFLSVLRKKLVKK